MLARNLGLIGLAFTAALPLTAQPTVWIDTESKVTTRIADTDTAPEVTAFRALLAGVPFKNFRYPHVDAAENVLFIADDPLFSGKAVHHGIYRSPASTGRLEALVVSRETPVPGATFFFDFIRGLQVDGVDFVFNATDTAGGRGLYHWSQGRLQLIARSGLTALPGVSQLLTEVEYGGLSGGRVLYSALAGKEHLLVLHELASGTARVLLRSGQPIPGNPEATFQYFSPQNWLDGSSIVFRAASVTDPHAKNAGRSRGIYAWTGIDWSQPDSSLALARLRRLVDGNTTVPGGAEASHFDDLRSAPVQGRFTAFSASGSGGSGVYLQPLGGEKEAPLKLIVDQQSTLPGVVDDGFRRFGGWVCVQNDSVVFTASADGYTGVFLYRIATDELFLLRDSRKPVEGKKVVSFEIGGSCLVRDRFAITVRFENKTSGVYLASIPAKSYKRMQAGADGR